MKPSRRFQISLLPACPVRTSVYFSLRTLPLQSFLGFPHFEPRRVEGAPSARAELKWLETWKLGWSGKRGSNPRHPPWQDGRWSGDHRRRSATTVPSGPGQCVPRWRRLSPVVVRVVDELAVTLPPSSGEPRFTCAANRSRIRRTRFRRVRVLAPSAPSGQSRGHASSSGNPDRAAAEAAAGVRAT